MNQKEKADRRQAVAEAVAAGASIAEVCCVHGVSMSFVYQCCRGAGVVVPRKQPTSPANAYRVVALLQQHPEMSFAAIARECGRSPQRIQQVYAAAVAEGIAIRQRGVSGGDGTA